MNSVAKQTFGTALCLILLVASSAAAPIFAAPAPNGSNSKSKVGSNTKPEANTKLCDKTNIKHGAEASTKTTANNALKAGAKSLFYRQIEDTHEITNVGLTYSIELKRNEKIAQVDSRFPFASGDQLRFHVQSNIEGYLYIVLKEGSGGDSALLFPATTKEDNHILAGADTLVPHQGVMEFDKTPGTEVVKFVLSPKKLENVFQASSRSVYITPKHSVDEAAAARYVVDFAIRDASKVTFNNTNNPPNFAKEPAVTVVSTSAEKLLAVQMDLVHMPVASAHIQAQDSDKSNAAGASDKQSADQSKTRSSDAANTQDINAAGFSNQENANVSASTIDSNSKKTENPTDSTRSTTSNKSANLTDPDSPSALVTDKWAVVIGISKFKNPQWNLLFPAKDATDLASFLVSEGHFAKDHVKVLTDQAATRENILTTLGGSWLPNNAKPNDIVLVYFASHGTSAAQDAAGKNFLVAYDTDPRNAFATGIELQDLARTIKRRLNSDRIIIVLDTCHSGAAQPGAKSLFPAQAFSYADLVQGTGQLIIASASEDQTAHDSLRYRNGIFTKHFIDGLKKNKRLVDVFTYTKSMVEEESTRDFHQVQSPVFKDSEWKGSDVVLVVPPAHPASVKN